MSMISRLDALQNELDKQKPRLVLTQFLRNGKGESFAEIIREYETRHKVRLDPKAVRWIVVEHIDADWMPDTGQGPDPSSKVYTEQSK